MRRWQRYVIPGVSLLAVAGLVAGLYAVPLLEQQRRRPYVVVPVPQYAPPAAGADFEGVVRQRLASAPPLAAELAPQGKVCGTPWVDRSDWELPDLLFLFGYHSDSALRLAELEAQFGGDPRYWLLSYRCGCTELVPAAERERLNASGRPASTWYLEEARRRGIADAPLLVELYRATYAAGNGMEPATTDDSVLWLRAHSGTTYGVPASEARFIAACGEQLDSVVAELQQTAPGEALSYYLAAPLAFERGDLAGMWRAVRRGNAAPDCNPLLGFPCDSVAAELDSGAMTNSFVTSRLAAFGPASPGESKVRSLLSMLVADAARRHSAIDLEACHRYVCRLGQLGMFCTKGSTLDSELAVLEPVWLAQAQWPMDSSWVPAGYAHFRNFMKCRGYQLLIPETAASAAPSPGMQPSSGQELPGYFVDHMIFSLRQPAETRREFVRARRPVWQKVETLYDYSSGRLDQAAAVLNLARVPSKESLNVW